MSTPLSHWKKALIALLIALVAFPLGMRLLGDTMAKTSLGDVAFEAKPALPGGGALYVPVADWGLRFDLFAPPVLIYAEPKRINRQGLLRAASGDSSVLDSAERDIASGVIKVLVLAAIFGIALATLLAFFLSRLWPRSGRRFALWGLGASSGLAVLFFLIGLITYSPSALDRPSFYARGEELAQLLDVIRREEAAERGSYQDNFKRVLKGVSSFLSEQRTPVPDGDRAAVLFSDLHTNALALPAMQQFAQEKPVFFVGDFGHEGNDMEAALLSDRVAALGSRVVAVSGNHDSSSLMLSLARAGVEVIGQRGVLQTDGRWKPGMVRVRGLQVAGWQDPLEWKGRWAADPRRRFSFSENPGSFEKAQEELSIWWDSLKQKPDVLLLHENTLAEDFAQRLAKEGYPRPLTILTGHDHRQWLASSGPITVVDAGSAGAGGLFGVGSETAEMAELYFSTGAKTLETVDMVQIDPLEGGALAQRVSPTDSCWLPCRYNIRKPVG